MTKYRKKAVGVDIGGTKIAFGLLNQQKELQYQSEKASLPFERDAMYELVVEGIQEVLTENKLREDDIILGIGVPGIVDIVNGIAIFQNNLSWDNFPLLQRLREDFPKVSNIVIDNDVRLAAFAEWQALNLGENDIMTFLTVSTGIASSTIVGGEYLRGQGFAGELGLFPVQANMGQEIGRLEQVASGMSIEKLARSAYGNPTITTEEVFGRFYQGDETAEKLITSVIQSIAHGIYAVSCVLDPQKIVLGGSVLKKNPIMLELLKNELKRVIIPLQKHVPDTICLSTYDNNAGLIGAALCVLMEEK